ncbi:CdaR family protein [Mangrovimonas aestuarii]|uniref:CdaR family protein n=1 Tax=Mangrovimonas aestuarii TaxID=3018443 RepID=UPI0023798DB3|nr:CdaR family protein [Mangrovimonas aestuarii]
MTPLIKARFTTLVKSRKLNVFLLFVVLSFSILVLIKLSKPFTNTITFSLNYKNVPESYVLVKENAPKIKVTVKTIGFNLLKYYFKTPTLDIDFSENLPKTESAYIWTRQDAYAQINRQFNKDEELISITPDTLYFKYDKYLVKNVPVKWNGDISFSPGYDMIGDFTITPNMVKIIGPAKEVDNISALETESITLKDIKSDIDIELALQIPKDLNLKFSTKQVNLAAEVKRFTEGTLKIPVNLLNVPDGITIKYFPKNVNVQYYTSLEDYNAISQSDFEVVCDYASLVKGQHFLVPELTKKPMAVKRVKINQQKVEFIITQ